MNTQHLALSSIIGMAAENPAGDRLGAITDVVYDFHRQRIVALMLNAMDGSMHGVHPASVHIDVGEGRFLLEAVPADFTQQSRTAVDETSALKVCWRKPPPAGLGHPSFFFDPDVDASFTEDQPDLHAPEPAQRRWYPGEQRHSEPAGDTRRGGVLRELPSERASTTG